MEQIQLKKINDKVVKPIKIKKIKTENIKGHELFPQLYANIFLCAKKNSDKTSTIYKILQSCINQDTMVIVFCETCDADAWIEIKKWLKEKNIPFSMNTSLYEEDGSNILDEIIKELKNEMKILKNEFYVSIKN